MAVPKQNIRCYTSEHIKRDAKKPFSLDHGSMQKVDWHRSKMVREFVATPWAHIFWFSGDSTTLGITLLKSAIVAIFELVNLFLRYVTLVLKLLLVLPVDSCCGSGV
ncbi:hypothetical protein EDC94DRAFT_648053 [Helicostylum pulchrum]|nr:hypothetical protein EDC94DRAFT_648053 [Helicostylum pulchrum]